MKNILLIGGSYGIGLAIAKELQYENKVYVASRTNEEIAEMMEEMGLPFAYHHFAEGESPAPPFLLFLSPGENTFSADNLAYFSCKQIDIELYTDKKQPELEEQVETE